jgi:hypothetical protein
MAHPSHGRRLWVHGSARLHHMGGSEAATCPEKAIYSKASTVSLDPHGRARTSGYAVRTSKVDLGPPRVQARPLEWDPDPGPPSMGPRGPRTEHTRALNRTQAGVRCRHVSRPSLVRTYPHTLLLPVQAETRCSHVAYCA